MSGRVLAFDLTVKLHAGRPHCSVVERALQRIPLEWTFERWCPEEAAVIEALGVEHFFDPETGRLPTVKPTLPRLAPYRCSYLELGTNEWVEHDPGQQ